ncbi:MAG: class III poly(R)-hydroxyalkanoic acid synthase subunit PhaC [Gammaproteobacteria bacterium]|nr:MAG: class III poly(R)-hydroxyalkanoic acid synthase subunit PhaC [Gammaproteobacteria bacterium]
MPAPVLSAEKILSELHRFAEKLTAGAKTFETLREPPCGVSEKVAVYCEDKLTLYRFRPRVKRPNKVPVLIVYALANRHYMTDLQEDRSMVRGLLDAGQDVYLIDWGYPDEADRHLELNDYIGGYLDRCVDEVRHRSGRKRINLLGICQGGVFSLCYGALHPKKVRNLVVMVTPVDFHAPGSLLSHWARRLDVDLLVDTLGNVPGELLNWVFLSLKPLRLSGQKYMDMVELLDNPPAMENFMRMEKWIHDSPDQAGEAFRQFLKYFFQANGLVKGKIVLGDRPVKLKKLRMPVLNVYATEDHIVPPASSTALKEHIGSKDYTEYAFKGGHIGIYVSGRAQKTIPPLIAGWLADRS